MLSTVFELAENSIAPSSYASPGYLPDWFYFSICDYAEAMSPEERERSIQSLKRHFGDLCSRTGDRFQFAPELKASYFKEKHAYFLAAAHALTKTDYDIFAGITPATAFDLALHSLSESYQNKRGFYIYTPGDRALAPLNTWLRTADLSHPFYVGGTINYHY
jgi:hypothetical protein